MSKIPALAAAAVFNTNPRLVSGSRPCGHHIYALGLGVFAFNMEMLLYLLVAPLGRGESDRGG